MIGVLQVGELYFNEADEMLVEINRAMRGAFALTLLYGFEERMFAYAAGRNVEFMPTKIENFKWRNGFIYGLGDMARTVGMDDPCPMHTQYLEYGRDKVCTYR